MGWSDLTQDSPLRRRMIDDMTIRSFTAQTQHDYIRHVKAFAAFLGRSPHKACAEDLRRYHLHLASSGVARPSMNSAVSALRFFFKVTLGRRDATQLMPFVREPQRLPEVLSVDARFPPMRLIGRLPIAWHNHRCTAGIR